MREQCETCPDMREITERFDDDQAEGPSERTVLVRKGPDGVVERFRVTFEVRAHYYAHPADEEDAR